jgi:diacylglycerol kinase family enzyme
VTVSADRDFAVYADGEHLTDLPATVRVLPQALSVIAPPGPLIGPPS